MRTRVIGRGRWFLGLLAVAWLNLAIQPCLMAMEATPDSVMDSVHAAHSDHVVESPDHDCHHCPPALNDHARACASTGSVNCSSVPELNNDGRNGPAKLKDLPTYVTIADTAMPFEFDVSPESPPGRDYTALKYSSEPSLNIRYCVFLK